MIGTGGSDSSDSGSSGSPGGRELAIQSARGSGSHRNYPPSNVIDGNTSFGSRWAGRGNPEEVRLDLGSNQTVDDVQIAWGRGNSRAYRFEIAGRSGTSGNWTTIFSGTSSGSTNDFENYNVKDINARQVRIRGTSSDSLYTNITEVRIFGAGGSSSPPSNPSPSSVSIVNSNSSNRSNSSNLNGQTVDDNIYVQVVPSDVIDRVQFFIDGNFVKTENFAPFDLRGGSANAQPFNTNNLSNGSHTLRAEVLFDNGSTDSISANFQVDNGGDDSNTGGDSNPGSGDFGLNPNREPWENFDLQDWVIDTPAFASDGDSQRHGENDLSLIHI